MRKTNLILSAAVLGLSALSANATLLYSATAPRTVGDVGKDSPSYDGDYTLNAGTANHILFDDAFIDRPGADSYLSLTNISVGIIRDSLAPATDVNVYIAPMLDNTAVSQGSNAGNDPNAGGDAVPDIGTPILIGTQSYGQNIAVVDDDLLSFNISQVLAGYTGYAGKLGFFIGVEFTDTDQKNGWVLAKANVPAVFPAVYSSFDYGTQTGPTLGYNLDAAWDYLAATNSDEFAVLPAADGPGNTIPLNSTFYASAEGSVVPEPTSLGLLLAGGLMMVRRNRKMA